MSFETGPLIIMYLYKLLVVINIPGTRQSVLLLNYTYKSHNFTLP